MRVIKPSDISLVSSTIPEDEYALYDAAATYNTGDRVIVAYESDGITDRTPHEIYESTADLNTGNYPPDSATVWTLISATNRWKMFDSFINTKTESDVDFTVVLNSGLTDNVALLEVEANSVDLIFKDDTGTILKSETINLDVSDTPDYWEYFFNPFIYKRNVIWEYPKYYTSTLEITFYTANGAANCGMVVTGVKYEIGVTQYTPSIGIDDYSKKETDDWGRTYLDQGEYAKLNTYDVWIDNIDIDYVFNILTGLRATPCVYQGNNTTSYEALIVYGFYKTFSIDIPGPVKSRISFDIEGLI